MNALPINLDDLLHLRAVESTRVEWKRAWNDGPVAEQVLRTICAFANDLQNLNGGYVILGVGEEAGTAVLPPEGLDPRDVDPIQRRIRGLCNRLDPAYMPRFCPQVVEGRNILVVWAPGSDHRPHQAPTRLARGAKERAYYVRIGSETIEARGRLLSDLLEQAAKVPFDDRRTHDFVVDDIRSALVREYLHEVRSDLLNEPSDLKRYRQMRLILRINDHEVPRNVALLFFSDDPERAFPGARIEVVEFADGAGGDLMEEHVFRGPLAAQVRNCLSYLAGRLSLAVQKVPERAEALTWSSYPMAAVEEAVVNAVYHRGYDGMLEPTKVYIYPDRMEVTSYPGPVHGLRHEHFAPGAAIPPVPARNRRIGELLKELRLAETRGTGVPKIHRAMAENGSPSPRFEFDEASRGYFTVVLPAHSESATVAALDG
jgi:ATP-dependent DNA helicase RecG